MGLRFLWALAIGLSLVWGQPARAESGICQARCPQVSNPRWQDYTPRQRAIATAIAHITATYYDRTALPLPVTPETVSLVVRAIEAAPAEAEFVCQRMYEHSMATVTIDNVDARLEQLHQHIRQRSCLM